MLDVLFVGGNKNETEPLDDLPINIDQVQNGMIALSAVQTGDYDAVIIEDQLPLMVPSRLIKELVSAKPGIPVISIVRGNERKKELLDDFGLGLFSYFEPDKHSGDELVAMLNSAKRFHDFKKEVP